jgi:rRNA biogenesis protein RRP5
MVFKLYLTDVDGARQIGKKALKKISPTEVLEKFNVYAALMNLEQKYGSEETQKAVLDEALLYCDKKKVYIQQANTLVTADKHEKAVDTFNAMIKKFPKSRKCWEAYVLYYMTKGDFVKANDTLQKALQRLPKTKHLRLITKFAAFHYKFGSIMDGHKIMEGILTSYPNRTDIWGMFLDLELAANRVEQVRSIFERVVHLKLSSKKMKNFLQRYLNFEKENGDEATQVHVKEIAEQYIEAKAK